MQSRIFVEIALLIIPVEIIDSSLYFFIYLAIRYQITLVRDGWDTWKNKRVFYKFCDLRLYFPKLRQRQT